MNDQTPLPASGWYADPASPETTLRYWDGAIWTEHVHPLQSQAPEEAASPEPGAEQESQAEADSVAESAPSEPAPDVAVPSAEGVDPSRSDADVPSADPSRSDAAEASEAPVTDAAAAPVGDAPAPAAPDAPAPSPEPAASAAQQPHTPYQQQPDPYGQQRSPANPYAPTAAVPQPGQGAPQPPAAPWSQGPGNPYQQPQPAQYGMQPGAPRSNKGLWIGLGIGGGVFLLLVIGIVVVIGVVFAGLTSAVRQFEPAPPPSSGLEAPGDEAPRIEGEVYGMGETFVVPDLSGTGDGWEVTVDDFSAEAADAASAAPGNKAFAVLVEVTNLGGSASDPYFAMTPTFVGSDGLEYTDYGMIEPGLYDLDDVDPGATVRFTATFEVPVGLEDTGTLLVYDAFMEQYTPVEVG
jgi:hypothetical protein